VTNHKHVYGNVVAGYTKEGETPLSWKQCGICGRDDPKNKRPAGAVDDKPKDEA
jgi:hypothetical protein